MTLWDEEVVEGERVLWEHPEGLAVVVDRARHVALRENTYRVTRHLDSYILLRSIWGVPLACLGSS